MLRLSDLVGKPVVLNHWFPSCPPCVAEMPDFEVAYQKYKDQVVFIGVQNMGVDTAENGQEFVNDWASTTPSAPTTTRTTTSRYSSPTRSPASPPPSS